jgi:hypothetical protein
MRTISCRLILTMPHVTIKIEIQMLGFMSFSTTFDRTSKIAQGKKNTVNAMLYCGPVNSRSAFMPATRGIGDVAALSKVSDQSCVVHPKRTEDSRSRNASRYNTARTGINLKSTLRRMRFVSFGSNTGSCWNPSIPVRS